MFYTVAPAQEPLREFSEEMVKTNTMQTMCAIHQSKGQLTSGESSTPTDFCLKLTLAVLKSTYPYHLDLQFHQPMHSTYILICRFRCHFQKQMQQ